MLRGDEGAPARIFQLSLLVQGLIIAFFAIRWLPLASRPALVILAIQGIAVALPIGTILVLESLAR